MDTVVLLDTEVRELAYYRDELPGKVRGTGGRYPRGFAVYFLWRGEELLYVGYACSLANRVSGHGDKPYDYMTWMTFDTAGEARYWEGALIRAFLPGLNIELGVNAIEAIQRGELADRLMPLPEAAKLLAVHPRTVKRRFTADLIPRAAIFKTPFPLLRWFVRREWVEAQMSGTSAPTN